MTPTNPVPGIPEVGAVIQPESLQAIETAQIIGSLFGYDMSRTLALILLAGVLFYFGVALSCILRLNGETHWAKVTLSSVVVFFIASPAWAYTLEGNWTANTMPLLDDVFKWLEGTGSMPSSFFALGIVILMGMMSWPLLQRILRLARARVDPPPADPPAQPS